LTLDVEEAAFLWALQPFVRTRGVEVHSEVRHREIDHADRLRTIDSYEPHAPAAGHLCHLSNRVPEAHDVVDMGKHQHFGARGDLALVRGNQIILGKLRGAPDGKVEALDGKAASLRLVVPANAGTRVIE